MSWKLEVNTAGDPPDKWTSNALRFATKEEADQYGIDLACRWTAVRDIRAAECGDPVNYRVAGSRLIRLDEEEEQR